MKLIAGLGNPGPQYDRTRHNVGYDVLDRLARRHAAGVSARSRFSGVCIEARIDQEPVLLLKPTTFMNRSGQSVTEVVRFYKLNASTDLLIIVDDVALECGTIRLRAEGSDGGHNGLADVEEKLGTTSYARLRVGIDGPGQVSQKDYVVGRFRPDQLKRLESALTLAADAAACWVRFGAGEAMNRFNRKNIA